MNVLWSYFWPIFAAGLVAGTASGWLSFRGELRRTPLLIGLLAAIAAALLWHGPAGAAERFRTEVERSARLILDDWEMTQVNGVLHRAPLSRRLMLSGPADDFQRGELVRVMSEVPGVSQARWSGGGGLPLLAEGTIASVLGFLTGLLIAYLVALRRRYNAQWEW